MIHSYISNDKIEEVFDALGWTLECNSPLEISDNNEGFAKGNLAKMAVSQLVQEIMAVVLDAKVHQWHRTYDSKVLLHEYLGFSEVEYQRWAVESSAIPQRLWDILIDDFLSAPSKYKDHL